MVAVDLAQAEIARFRVSEVEPAYARAGPHRERLRDQHAGVLLHIEQLPERALLGVIGARWVTRGRPDAAILLLNELRVAQAFFAAVAPLLADALVQAFGKGFRQAVGDGLGHDGVVVVVLGAEAVAQLLKADAAGDREGADVVGQPGLFGRDEVDQRAARLAAFPVSLLTEKVEALLHLGPRVIGVELDVVTHCVGREKAVDAARGDQLLRNDLVEQGIAFGVDLARLRSVLRMLEDAGVNAFESPGVEEGRPVNEVAQGGQGKVI